MRVKIKTIKEMRDTVEPFCDKWKECANGDIHVEKYGDNRIDWNINFTTVRFFGVEIEVEKYHYHPRCSFTHCGEGMARGHLFHESWFAPEVEDFLSEKEMEI